MNILEGAAKSKTGGTKRATEMRQNQLSRSCYHKLIGSASFTKRLPLEVPIRIHQGGRNNAAPLDKPAVAPDENLGK